MRVVITHQRSSFWLLWILVLALTGTCLSQNQNPRRFRRPFPQQPPTQQPSTTDQEAEPNTANYPQPQRPAYNPGNQPAASPAAQPQSGQPAGSIGMPGQGQPVNPGTQANQAQSNPNPTQQGQQMIGPLVPIPPTPEQLPPGTARITYQNGLLSVESVNSRLSDILNGIHTKTGIQFEGLQAGQDRVAGKFGPAPADAVLTTLLTGSRFDYVIVGQPANPSMVQRVILTPSSATGTVAAVGGGAIGAPQRSVGNEEEENSDESENQPEQIQAPEPQQVQPQPVPSPNANNAPKTTEQLLEELKRMQMQQQQNQQRQLPPAPIKPSIPQ